MEKTLSSRNKNNKNLYPNDSKSFDNEDDSFTNDANIYSFENSFHTNKKRSGMFDGHTSVRRSSVQDRAQQILERNKAVGLSRADESENTDRLKSYESTLAELMDGIIIPSETENEDFKMNDQLSFKELLGSPGDSCEISAADLEVGTHASRRAKEKTTDRRARRQSLDQAPHISPRRELKAKNATSPNVLKVLC